MLSHLIQHRTKHLDEPLDSTGEKEQPVIWFQSIESNHFAFELNDISPTIIGDIRRGRQLATECCAQSTQFFSKTQGQAQKIKTYRKTLSHHVKLKEQNKRVFTANALLRYFFLGSTQWHLMCIQPKREGQVAYSKPTSHRWYAPNKSFKSHLLLWRDDIRVFHSPKLSVIPQTSLMNPLECNRDYYCCQVFRAWL